MVMKDDENTDVQVEVLTSADGDQFNDVPDYRTADKKTRAAMDKMIATVDWDDLNTIMVFGQEALDKIAVVSDAINDRALKDDSFMAEMRKCAEEIENMDVSETMQRVQMFAKASLNTIVENKGAVATGLLGTMLMNPLYGLLAGIGFKGAQVAKEKYDAIKGKATGEIDHAKQAEAIRDDLRKAILSTRSIVKQLEDGRDKIPLYVSEVNALGAAQTEADKLMALAIGAGREALRRLHEDILPKMTATDAASLDKLRERQMAGHVMERTIDGHIASRVIGLNSMVVLYETKRMYASTYLKFQEHLNRSVREWNRQIAHGNLMVDQMDLQLVGTAADKKGIDLHEKAEKLHETTRLMHQKSMGQGTYDMTKIAEATERLVKQIGTDLSELGAARIAQQAARDRLNTATKDLASKFQESVQKDSYLVLESGTKSAAALEFEQSAKVDTLVGDNDNTAQPVEAKPGAKKPRAPRAAKPSAKPK